MTRGIVSLEQAWFWSCPDCGTGNFARMVRPDSLHGMPEDVIRNALDLEPWEAMPEDVEGEFVTAPEVVQCIKCSTEFDCFEDVEDDQGDPPETGDIPDRLPEDF